MALLHPSITPLRPCLMIPKAPHLPPTALLPSTPLTAPQLPLLPIRPQHPRFSIVHIHNWPVRHIKPFTAYPTIHICCYVPLGWLWWLCRPPIQHLHVAVLMHSVVVRHGTKPIISTGLQGGREAQYMMPDTVIRVCPTINVGQGAERLISTRVSTQSRMPVTIFRFCFAVKVMKQGKPSLVPACVRQTIQI